jgi:hypothetical protein
MQISLAPERSVIRNTDSCQQNKARNFWLRARSNFSYQAQSHEAFETTPFDPRVHLSGKSDL